MTVLKPNMKKKSFSLLKINISTVKYKITIKVYITTSIISFLGFSEFERGTGYFPSRLRRSKIKIWNSAGIKIMK